MSVTNSEFVFVGLVIQHAMRMRHVILSTLPRLAVPHFSIFSYKRHIIREKVIEREMCVLIFCTVFV